MSMSPPESTEADTVQTSPPTTTETVDLTHLYDPIPAVVGTDATGANVAAPNIPAPVFGQDDAVGDTDLTDAAKLDYLYQTAKQVRTLLDSVTPEQVARVNKIAGNPVFRRMFSGLGAD